ncbi:MAG: hypothetical protein K9H26_10680 [Prolixibacteraceae bacterium]|nr:hypothetical protein [Prolixibacteraceae bacterium]
MNILDMVECFDDEEAINAAYPTGSEMMAYNRATGTLWMWGGMWIDTEQTMHQIIAMLIAYHYEADPTSKLAGIEENANNYTHPASHSMSIMNETTDRKIMTAAEREKISDRNFILSESITNGNFVKLLANNTIEKISEFLGFILHNEIRDHIFENNQIGVIRSTDIAFDPNNPDKFVIVYCKDVDDYGRAIVGTIDGTDITFGTAVVYRETGTSKHRVCFDPNNANKIIVTYVCSYKVEAIIGTIDGIDITFGNYYEIDDAQYYLSLSVDPNTNNQFGIAYTDTSNNGKISICSINGTIISVVATEEFSSENIENAKITFDPNNANKFIIAYTEYDNNYESYVIIGTISDTNITLGTPVFFDDDVQTMDLAFDPHNANKILIGYYRYQVVVGEFNRKTFAIVGNINSMSVTFGTANFIFGWDSVSSEVKVLFDPNTSNQIAFFQSKYSLSFVGTINGTAIAFEKSVCAFGNNLKQSIAFAVSDDSQYALIYSDIDNNDIGMVGLSTTTSNTTNLKENTLLGILKESGMADESKPVQLLGSVITGLSGLTVGSLYYLQNDGTLSTDSGGVKIGRAISATEIETIKTF